MKKIVTVLNSFEKVDDILQKAVELTNEHSAILEVVYVHETSLFDLPDYFRLDGSKGQDNGMVDKDLIKKDIKEKVLKLGLDKDFVVLVFIDDTVDRVLTQVKDDTDTLIIMFYHHKITEKLLKKIHLPILVIKNSKKDYNKIVVPVDLGESTKVCIDLANNIFPNVDKHLLYDYRYIVDTSLFDDDLLGIPSPEILDESEINREFKKRQLENFELLKKESGYEGTFLVEKLSVEEDLAMFITDKDFDLTVLCAHEIKFLLSGSISFLLLKEITNDILILNY